MIEVERYYRVLEIEPGASPEEVHQGYLDLTWVWHPDRFVGHPRLQQKAQCKLQQLNEAHARLRSCRAIHQKRDLRTQPKPTVYQAPQQPSPSEGFYKSSMNPSGNQSATDNENKRTIQTSKPYIRSNTQGVGEWLD